MDAPTWLIWLNLMIVGRASVVWQAVKCSILSWKHVENSSGSDVRHDVSTSDLTSYVENTLRTRQGLTWDLTCQRTSWRVKLKIISRIDRRRGFSPLLQCLLIEIRRWSIFIDILIEAYKMANFPPMCDPSLCYENLANSQLIIWVRNAKCCPTNPVSWGMQLMQLLFVDYCFTDL